MSNPLKLAFDISDLQNKIRERQRIIHTFYNLGYLNMEERGKAKQIILELRVTDDKVLAATASKYAGGSFARFEDCPDSIVVNELNMQLSILQTELTEKLKEEDESHNHA